MDSTQLKVNISKILNWQGQQDRIFLNIEFYSELDHSLIASRLVRAFSNQDDLDIGVTLTIKFKKEDSQLRIIIRKSQWFSPQNPQTKSQQIVAETQIDLNELSQNKTKYYPTGWKNQLLEVSLAEGCREKIKFQQLKNKKSGISHEQQNFLRERKNFLQKVNENDVMMRRAFTQKIYSLINTPTSSQVNSNIEYEPSSISNSNIVDFESNQAKKEEKSSIISQSYYTPSSSGFLAIQKPNRILREDIRVSAWKKIMEKS